MTAHRQAPKGSKSSPPAGSDSSATRQHTPGPWQPMNDGPRNRQPWEPWIAYAEAAPGLTIASPHNTEPICRVNGYLQPVEANARLIAAAPDLLAALETMLLHSELGEYDSQRQGKPRLIEVRDIARAALRKAGELA